jgi:hypothetical protein
VEGAGGLACEEGTQGDRFCLPVGRAFDAAGDLAVINLLPGRHSFRAARVLLYCRSLAEGLQIPPVLLAVPAEVLVGAA